MIRNTPRKLAIFWGYFYRSHGDQCSYQHDEKVKSVNCMPFDAGCRVIMSLLL
jgi:hypothetical protein